MGNWSTITIDDLKASEHGAIIDAAQTSAVGGVDPIQRTIADICARIRATISPGNILDVDVLKIPNSLRDLASRMCARQLKTRIQMDLTVDERDQRKEDNAYLTLLSKEHTAFETADNAADTGEMQQTGDMMEQATGGNLDSAASPTVSPALFATRLNMTGL